VIEELTKPIFIQITRNVCKNSPLLHDLHYEAIIVILEKQYDLNEIRNLQHFFAAIVWRTWHSNKFKKKYFSANFEFIENIKIEDAKKEIDYSEIINFLNNSPQTEEDFYEQNLLKLYIELGDSKKISQKTLIPYRTVANDIKKIKDKIKTKHNEKNSS